MQDGESSVKDSGEDQNVSGKDRGDLSSVVCSCFLLLKAIYLWLC